MKYTLVTVDLSRSRDVIGHVVIRFSLCDFQ